jgi:hypothetical protein
MQFADSSESLQQILMGAYPQLEEGAADPEAGMSVEEAHRGSRVIDPSRSVAARKRAHEWLVLSTGGITDET